VRTLLTAEQKRRRNSWKGVGEKIEGGAEYWGEKRPLGKGRYFHIETCEVKQNLSWAVACKKGSGEGEIKSLRGRGHLRVREGRNFFLEGW